MRDTSAEAARVQTAVLRGLDGATRLNQALELSDAVRALAFARLKSRYPELDHRQLVAKLLRQTLAPHELPPALR
jgi:hypothetical protein